MNLGRIVFVVGSICAVICFAAVGSVDAAPAPGARALIIGATPVGIEPVGCNCVRHVHRHRYVRRVERDYVAPVYPAPPVGLTFRKLFDAGLL